jgi:hypothetical protein
VHPGGHALANPQAGRVELVRLVRVVAQQPQLADSEGEQHLCRRGVVAFVGTVTQSAVGLVGVQAGVLEPVGVELVVEADAPAFLAQVEQVSPGVGQAFHGLAQLGAAVTALAAEDVSGQAFAVQPHQWRPIQSGRRVAEPQREVLTTVDEPVEGEHRRVGREAVDQTERHGHARPDGRLGRQASHHASMAIEVRRHRSDSA